MTHKELKDKAASLPLLPGVYLMRNSAQEVIYVGKAKKLKNRVSQYFQDTDHSLKTRLMVSKIHSFEVIVAPSEFEALVLECSLIKRHKPKYNILLKDDKGYPYIRIDMRKVYPTISLANKVADDGALYYGPFGSRSTTQGIIDALILALKLPGCHKQFPRDIGKDRPCLNYDLKQCAGWCLPQRSRGEYLEAIEQVRQLLAGNYAAVARRIREEMLSAADALNFELAASLRDRLNAVEALGQKQLMIAGRQIDTDVIGYAQSGTKACFAVLHFFKGDLVDKEYELLAAPEDEKAAVSSLLKQYYLNRGYVPKNILLPFAIEDSGLFSQLLLQQYGKKVYLRVPLRGDSLKLVTLAVQNAAEEASRATDKEERIAGTLKLLGKMLTIVPPVRIEAFDISNISGTDIVGGMVVFQNGKPLKSAYKRFKIQDLAGQDDYASMHQVILRRFRRYKAGDPGFDALPDLVLIDGGIQHVQTALDALRQLDVSVPVFGAVKDDRHRTRALVTERGDEIAINNNAAVFSLIGNIQEEVHRFAIGYHRKLRNTHLRYSELDGIDGIGPKRKQALLKHFKSLTAIAGAELTDLERLLPKDAAAAVYKHFQNKERA